MVLIKDKFDVFNSTKIKTNCRMIKFQKIYVVQNSYASNSL